MDSQAGKEQSVEPPAPPPREEKVQPPAPLREEKVEQSSAQKAAASGSLAKMFAAKSVAPKGDESGSAKNGNAALSSLFASRKDG